MFRMLADRIEALLAIGNEIACAGVEAVIPS
ncbi:hypothetical protein J2X13_005609 [Aminobacter aminovorans]|nr:hypothetical protein [Aminobacter aminovorans]